MRVRVPLVALAAEALVRPREPGREVVGEVVADDVVRIVVPVRLELDLRAEPDWYATALDAELPSPIAIPKCDRLMGKTSLTPSPSMAT